MSLRVCVLPGARLQMSRQWPVHAERTHSSTLMVMQPIYTPCSCPAGLVLGISCADAAPADLPAHPPLPCRWDVAAITDFHPDYSDACGTCFEIACDQTWIHDNYGKELDRTYSCYDTSQVCWEY